MMIDYKLLVANECNLRSYISKTVKCENPCPNALPSRVSCAYHFKCMHFVVDHNVLLNSYTRLFQDLSTKVLIKE